MHFYVAYITVYAWFCILILCLFKLKKLTDSDTSIINVSVSLNKKQGYGVYVSGIYVSGTNYHSTHTGPLETTASGQRLFTENHIETGQSRGIRPCHTLR